MRDEKTILKLIRKEIVQKKYLKRYNKLENDNAKTYWGICHVIHALEKLKVISFEEECQMNRLIKDLEIIKGINSTLAKPFFDGDGIRVNSTWGGDFLWKPKSLPPRLKWLDKQIK